MCQYIGLCVYYNTQVVEHIFNLYGAENEDRGCACVTVNNEDHLNVIDHDIVLYYACMQLPLLHQSCNYHSLIVK